MSTTESGVLVPDEILTPTMWASAIIGFDISPKAIVLDKTNLIIINGNKRVYIPRDGIYESL